MEGYPHPLRKQKIYVIGETSVLDTYFQSIFQTYSDELLHRHKVVVIFSDAYIKHQPRWCKEIFSDAVFRVRDNQDLRLAATYIQHTSKPLCVIWYSSDIPSVMVQNLLQSKDDITFITGGTNIVKQDYTSVFWNTKTSYDEIYSTAASKMGPEMLKELDLKTIVQECKGSGVSLVWSSFRESDKKGALYWYDLQTTSVAIPPHASDYLRILADALESNSSFTCEKS